MSEPSRPIPPAPGFSTAFVTDAVVMAGAGGKIVHWSSGAQVVFGFTSAEVAGRDFDSILDVPLEAGRHTGTGCRKDGSRFDAVVQIEPWNDAFVVLVHIAGERTDSERQQNEARRLGSLGRLAGTMAHEFNNVLMAIETFTEVLRRRTLNEVPVQNAVARIQQSLSRGRRITDEILRFMRNTTPVMSTIDVCSWLTEFMPEAKALTGGRAELDAEDGLYILGDLAQLNQVLANLIINARDAAPEGPILIAAHACNAPGMRGGEGCMQLSIIDRGSGMTPEVRERVFEPLFTTKRSGTGLGLALVHQVVTAHGGTITIESNVGSGTAFHIILPLLAGAPSEPVQRVPDSVLIVEDDPSVAAALSAMLEVEAINVRTVSHGQHALTELARELPSAVILDLGLPDISGAELFAQIAVRHPLLPIVFITAHDDDSTVSRYLSRPHVAFLRKPFEAEQLLKALRKIGAKGVQSPDGFRKTNAK
jgi:two-component system cell cycle sensor histidine kinase/response regulator CckA